MTFATLRLGKTSVEDIRLIDAQESGILTSPMTISVVCTQVPADLLPGTYTFCGWVPITAKVCLQHGNKALRPLVWSGA